MEKVLAAAGLCALIAVTAAPCFPDEPAAVGPLPRSAHGRPFFMPPRERERILKLIRAQPWAKAELARVRTRAAKGDGFWAGFLYALEGDGDQLATAGDYLMKHCGPKAWSVRTYKKRLADPNHFKAGAPHLAGVYYGLRYEPFVVYDWVCRGLSADDRRTIEEGIKTQGRYRMRAMDRWYQTPNLVFKPTVMAALAGLATHDEQLLRWGLFRRKPHGARLGGYFPVLEVMLRDGGPWLEAPIYPIAHRDLWCMAILSRYGKLYDGRDWFALRTRHGDSAQGLMDYYVDTAYPIERTGHGAGQVRVATYGDGATNPGGDLFLVNPAGAGLDMGTAIVAAYKATGDRRVAAFVAMIDGYKPDLWNRRALPAEAPLPPAPSKVWPNYGLAMLRSDESSAYWTSGKAIAVFQIMSQGYGHDHRDKLAIMLHGAGRLLYPDYNAIQYESSAVGWTRHSCAHNTMLVDEQDTANAAPTGIRHAFAPEVKYLATSAAAVFEGVAQTRVLMLTAEYLLDVFHAESDLPHTYDYMLHCLGEARPPGGSYRAAPDLMPRYWVIEDKRAMTTGKGWSFEFVRRDKPGSRGGKYAPQWYDHAARVRVSVAAAPDTQVVHGVWGGRYAAMVEAKHRGKRKLDRLASLVVRRAGVPATAFIVTHEPTANQDKPQVRAVDKLAASREALLVRVEGSGFTDYAAVSFGPQQDRPVHTLSDGRVTVRFRDYAYVRVRDAGGAVARGDVIGLRVPGLDGPVTLAGRRVSGAKLAAVLERSAAKPTVPPTFPPRCPLKVRLSPRRLRVWLRDRKSLRFQIHNTLRQPVRGRISLDLPTGFRVRPQQLAFGPIAPGEEATVAAEFTVSDPAAGKHTIPYRVAFRQGDDEREITPLAQPLVAYAGPTIESVYQFPKPPVYRAVTSRYTAALRMSDGAPIYLADDADQVRLDGEPLFLLAEGDSDKPIQLLGRRPKTGGVWVGHKPANLVAEASGRDGKRYAGARWQALFMVNRILFRMDPDWTRFERARFLIPGTWRSPGGKPHWARIVAVDHRGREHAGRPGASSTVSAALLEFPGSGRHLAFQFDPPVPVTFRQAGLEFSIHALNRGNWQLGFTSTEGFDRWRGKEKASRASLPPPGQEDIDLDADRIDAPLWGLSPQTTTFASGVESLQRGAVLATRRTYILCPAAMAQTRSRRASYIRPMLTPPRSLCVLEMPSVTQRFPAGS